MHAAGLRRRRPHACRPPGARVRHRRDRRAALFLGLLGAGLHRGRHELHPAAGGAHAEHALGRRPLRRPARRHAADADGAAAAPGPRRDGRSPSSAPRWSAMSARATAVEVPFAASARSRQRWAAISAGVITRSTATPPTSIGRCRACACAPWSPRQHDVRAAGRAGRHAGADQRRPVLVRARGAAPDAALRSRSPAGRRARSPGPADRRGCLVDHHRAARLRRCSADAMGHLWIKEAAS